MTLHIFDQHAPIYRQIFAVLMNEIRDQYEPGEYLPSEQSLATRFGVNRHTVRRAIDELILEGIVERFRGRGTVVLDMPLVYPLQTGNRFTETLTKMGQKPLSRLLQKEMAQASSGIARRLEIEPGATIVALETLRMINERPVGISSQFLPSPYAEVVYAEYESGSLHQFLADRFGVQLKRKYSLITAVLPQEADARLLQMSRRLPVLRLKNVNIEVSLERPVEYAVARARAEMMQIRINFD